MKHIAIIAPHGSGKTSLARALCARINRQRMAFADEPRRAYSLDSARPDFVRLSSDPATKDSPCATLGGRTPRDVLIEYSEAAKLADPFIWTRRMSARLDALPHDVRVVIDDVYFIHEIEELDRRGDFGFVVLHREDEPQDWTSYDLPAVLDHLARYARDLSMRTIHLYIDHTRLAHTPERLARTVNYLLPWEGEES